MSLLELLRWKPGFLSSSINPWQLLLLMLNSCLQQARTQANYSPFSRIGVGIMTFSLCVACSMQFLTCSAPSHVLSRVSSATGRHHVPESGANSLIKRKREDYSMIWVAT